MLLRQCKVKQQDGPQEGCLAETGGALDQRDGAAAVGHVIHDLAKHCQFRLALEKRDL